MEFCGWKQSLSGREIFLFMFLDFQQKNWSSEKKFSNGCKHFLLQVQRISLKENFLIIRILFFKNVFGIWEKNFQGFGVLLIGSAFKIAFFLPEGLCDEEHFFTSELDNYKKFLASDRDFCGPMAKKVSIDFRNWIFSSGWTFWEKTFVSQNFLLSWIFSDTGRKMFGTLSYFFRQGHRESNLCVRRYFVTKNKMFQMFQRKVFFIIVLGLWSEKFALSKKIIVLVLKTLFFVSRRSFSDKIFVSKRSFFCKNPRTLREKISDFWRSCFRQVWHHSILLLPRKVSGKVFSKKFFFHCFQTWRKKSTIERTSGWMWKLYSTCTVEIYFGKIFFSKLFDFSFHLFRVKKCKIWKKFPQNCKNSILHV